MCVCVCVLFNQCSIKFLLLNPVVHFVNVFCMCVSALFSQCSIKFLLLNPVVHFVHVVCVCFSLVQLVQHQVPVAEPSG